MADLVGKEALNQAEQPVVAQADIKPKEATGDKTSAMTANGDIPAANRKEEKEPVDGAAARDNVDGDAAGRGGRGGGGGSRGRRRYGRGRDRRPRSGDREPQAGEREENGQESEQRGDRPERRRRNRNRGNRDNRDKAEGDDGLEQPQAEGQDGENGSSFRGRRRGPRRGRGRGGRGYDNGRRLNSSGEAAPGEGGDEEGNEKPQMSFKRTTFTHFISIPFNTPAIQEKFEVLRSEILEKFGSNEELLIGEDLFQNPAKIHLTFGIMTLKDKDEETAAVDLLKKCVDDIVKPVLAGGALDLKIQGVETIPNKYNPSKWPRVLYAKITEGTEKLQTIADQVVAAFAEKGIMEPQTEPVRLHMTLMNVTFRGRAFRRQPKYWTLKRPIYRFDSRPLVEQYADYMFAESFPVTGLHLSNARLAKGADGYYEPLEVVPF